MDDKKIFDTEKVIQAYFKLALPVVFSMVITLIYNLADTYFIAQTNDARLVAGVSVCAPLFTALMAIGNIFGQGGSSLIARLLGKGDQESGSRASAFCFYFAIMTGIIIALPLLAFYRPVLGILGAGEEIFDSAKSYYMVIAGGAPLVILSFIHTNLLRSEGMSKLSMSGTVAGSLLNIVLDPIFIRLLGWGAFGAALATVLGYVLTDVLCMIFVLKKSTVLSINIHKSHVHWNEFTQIFSIGFTAALTNIASSICIVFMNQFLKSLPDGVNKIAAYGIVGKVTMIVMLILVGFSFGGVPLFAFLYGSKEWKKLKQLLRFCTAFLCGLAAAESMTVFFLAKPLIGIFIDDPGRVRDGTLMMRWQIAGMVFCAVVLLYTCVFQACGKPLPALAMSLSRQGVLFIIVFLTATAIAGYQGFLVSQLTSDVLSAGLALVMYRQTFTSDMGRMS